LYEAKNLTKISGYATEIYPFQCGFRMRLSHLILKSRYHYLFIALAFCIFGILDALSPMSWWLRFSGYGALLIAAALRSVKVVESRRAEVELLRAKEAAEAANEAKSLFLANMSHEIRTPINSILRFVEILLNEPLTEVQRESVEIMKLSAETLLSLIDEILDLSKIESDTVQLDETVIDLKKLVLDAVELVRAQVEGKGVALKCRLPAVIPSVMGDPLRLATGIVESSRKCSQIHG
jgi:signal transduction histidine kinase